MSVMTPRKEEMLQEAMRARGWIINSYAQVEYLMADTVMRCRSMPEYSHLPQTVPYLPSKRAPRLQQMINAGGPLVGSDPTALQGVVDRFLEAEHHRHMLVHGFLSVECVTPLNIILYRFRKLEPTAGDDENVAMLLLEHEELMELERAAARDGQTAVGVFQEIHERLGWKAPGVSGVA